MALKLISVTDRAAQRLSEIIAGADKPVTGLRLGVKNAGCAGMAYTMDYVAEPLPGDDHVQEKGIDIYIDPKAMLFLLGTQMDFVTEKMKSGFTFTNPNQTGECGCGESVELKPADLKALSEARSASQH